MKTRLLIFMMLWLTSFYGNAQSFSIVSTPDGTIPCASDLSINLAGYDCGNPYSYSWAPSAGLSATTGCCPIATPTVTTTYTCTLTGTCGDEYATITISGSGDATPITGPTSVCVGATISLADATAGGTWSSSATGTATVASDGTVTGVAGGTVTISYTYTNACSVSVTATSVVTVNPLPDPGTISGGTSVCMGSTLSLTDGVAGGTWSSVTTSVATINSSGVVTLVSPGTTVISYTVTNSCGPNAATVTITVNPLPAAISGPSAVCVGSTINLTDATGSGTWSSSSSGTATVDGSGVVTGVAAGSVTITYTTSSGCYVTATITVNPLPAAITGLSSVCVGLSITLSDATGGGTWSSSSSGTATVDGSGVVTGVAGGTPTITYTLSTGCYVTKGITVNALPTVNAGVDIYVCGSSTGTLTATGSGTPTLSYTWVGASPTTTGYLSSTSGTPVTVHITPTVTATYAYTVTVTDGHGCTNFDVVNVNYNHSATVTAGTVGETSPWNLPVDNAFTFCSSMSSLTLLYSLSGGTYSWTGPAGTISGSTTSASVTIVPTATATYSVTMTEFGCSVKATAKVIVPSSTCSPCDYFTAHQSCSTSPTTLQSFHTIDGATITNAMLPVDIIKNIWFSNGSVTMNDVGMDFESNVIFMSNAATMTIASTSDVTFNGSHLFSCSWTGIALSNPSSGRVVVSGGTLIENASKAINASVASGGPAAGSYSAFSGSGCVINVEGSVFNKNSWDISLSHTATATGTQLELPYHVVNTILTDRDFECYSSGGAYYPFVWPDFSTLKTQTSTDAYDPQFGLNTYTASSSVSHTYGMFLTGGNTDVNGYHSFSIGDNSTSANSNIIDNITSASGTGGGINVSSGNLNVYNTIFREFSGTATGLKYTSTSGGTSPTYQLSALGNGGSGYTCGNRFYGLLTAVKVVGDCDVHIKQATISGGVAISSAFTLSTSSSYHYAAFLNPHAFNVVDVENNHIYDVDEAIWLNTTVDATGSTLTINNNVIEDAVNSSTGGSAATNQYLQVGIHVRCPNTNMLNATINGNTVWNATNGIWLFPVTAITMSIQHNNIKVKDYGDNTLYSSYISSPVYPYCGININTVDGTAASSLGVNYNTVSGDGFVSSHYLISSATSGLMGIYCQDIGNASSLIDLSCNTVADINVGFYFNCNASLDYVNWTKNIMMRDKCGIMLGGANAKIGSQTGDCNPSDNMWDNGTLTTGLASGWPGWPGPSPSYSTIHLPYYKALATGATSVTDPDVYQTYSFGNSSFSKIYYRGYSSDGIAYTCTSSGSGVPDDRFIPYRNGGSSTSNAYVHTTTPTTAGNLYDVSTTGGCSTGATFACTVDPCAPSYSRTTSHPQTGIGINANAVQHYTIVPNPNNGDLSITQELVKDGSAHIRIMNIAGSLVYDDDAVFANGKTSLSLSTASSGVYIVELIDSNGQRFTSKMIIQK